MSSDAKDKILATVKRYPLLFVCGGLSIALLVVLYLRFDLIDQRQTELEAFTKESRRYSANIANSAQLQEQLDFLVRANNVVKTRAMKLDTLAQNLQYFYRLELETGVKYLDLRQIGKPASFKVTPATVYVPVNYNVSIIGQFPQVIKFLRHLEQGEYICRVNSAAASNSSEGVTVTLNFDILGVP